MPRRKRNTRRQQQTKPLYIGYAKVTVGRQRRRWDDHRPGVVVAIGEWVEGGKNSGQTKR